MLRLLVTAWITYGYSLNHLRLQPGSPGSDSQYAHRSHDRDAKLDLRVQLVRRPRVERIRLA